MGRVKIPHQPCHRGIPSAYFYNRSCLDSRLVVTLSCLQSCIVCFKQQNFQLVKIGMQIVYSCYLLQEHQFCSYLQKMFVLNIVRSNMQRSYLKSSLLSFVDSDLLLSCLRADMGMKQLGYPRKGGLAVMRLKISYIIY